MLAFARWTQPDFVGRARQTGVAELLTIPYSHYCEMAMWSMQLAGRPLVERAYMPGQHVLALLSLRVGGTTKHLSSSSFVTKSGGKSCAEQARRTQNKKRSTAVPALCLPDGRVLRDSWEIVAESGLLPITEERKQVLDAELGPRARHFAYGIMLQARHRAVWDAMLTDGAGWLWCVVYWLGGNYLWRMMRELFAVGDSALGQANDQALKKLFDALRDQQLRGAVRGFGGSNRFLHGDELSAEDVALASLAGPVLLPGSYCEARFAKFFDAALNSDEEARRRVEQFRQHDVGVYVTGVYEECRMAAQSAGGAKKKV